MEVLNDKATGDALPADQWNQVPSEMQNIITGTSQSLTNADLNQLGKGVAAYAATADAYTDGGSANAIVLTPVTGFQGVPAYYSKMKVRYTKSATNTGAVTINVNGIGVLNLLDQFGAALLSGDQTAGEDYEAEYDLTIDGGNPGFKYQKPSAVANDLPRNYIDGFTTSNNSTDATHDIDVQPGVCKDSANAVDFSLASALGKQIDVAWAEGGTPGATAGGFPTGLVLGGAQWYRFFAIRRASGQIDAGFDTSATAANLLADAVSYSEYRQIAWVYWDGASIRAYFQEGDEFRYESVSADYSATNPGTGVVPVTLLAPPDSVAVTNFRCSQSPASGSFGYYLRANDETIGSGAADTRTQAAGEEGTVVKQIHVDGSSGCSFQATGSTAGTSVNVGTYSFIYRRGKE